MATPRPILKSTSRRQRPTPAVHFPPSPVLTRACLAHSPSSYDRSPIRVQTNECALPERGCPGRTYTLSEDEPALSSAALKSRKASPLPASGKHLHPRSLVTSYRPMQPFGLDRGTLTDAAAVPSLIPDISSESSEESDDFASPPADQASFTPYASPWSLAASTSHPIAIPQPKPTDAAAPLGFCPESPSTPTQLSFLPHAPSAPDGARPRRRKESRSPRRTVVDHGDDTGGFKHLDLSTTLTSCHLDDGDDGCLAGF